MQAQGRRLDGGDRRKTCGEAKHKEPDSSIRFRTHHHYSSCLPGNDVMTNIAPYGELASLKYHWGSVYEIRKAGPWKWEAIAKFGSHDILYGETADELRHLIHLHYGPSTYGYEQAKKMGR
jgi:hypothetical protein